MFILCHNNYKDHIKIHLTNLFENMRNKAVFTVNIILERRQNLLLLPKIKKTNKG